MMFFPSSLGFGVGGHSYSSFLASAVRGKVYLEPQKPRGPSRFFLWLLIIKVWSEVLIVGA